MQEGLDVTGGLRGIGGLDQALAEEGCGWGWQRVQSLRHRDSSLQPESESNPLLSSRCIIRNWS